MTRRGFTLLETLLALALTALVLGALARSLAGAARSRSLATAESDRLAAARTILLRLGAELEAAAGEAGIVVEPDAAPGLSSGSRVHLVTTVRTDASTLPASDRRAVAYEVDRAAGVLLRHEETAPMAPEAATPAPLAVLAGVRRLAVRSSDGTEWHDAWHSAALPRAVELVLGVDDGAGGVEELATTVTVALGR